MTLAQSKTSKMRATADFIRCFMKNYGISEVLPDAPADWTVDQAMDYLREVKPDWIIFDEEGTK